MAQNLDLLGDPIPENWGGRGRPAHIPTAENSNKVMVLLAMDWSEEKIAAALGITKPTLRKHYFRQLKVRDEARARLESAMVYSLATKAVTGDVPAYREVSRAMEKADMKREHQAFQATPVAESRPGRLGKKEERQAAAEEVVAGKFAPGAPPARLMKH